MSVILYPAQNPDYTKNGVPLRITGGTLTYADAGRYDVDITLPAATEEFHLLENGMHLLVDVPRHVIPAVNLGAISYWRVPAGSSNVPLYAGIPHWETFLYENWEPYRSYMQGDRRSYGGKNWRCTTGHGGLGTAPPETPELWTEVSHIYWETGAVVTQMPAGTQMMMRQDGAYMLVYLLDGKQGYVDKTKVQRVSAATEDYVIPARTITRQSFQITEIRKDRKNGTVTVHAEHDSYDLGGNILGACSLVGVTPQTALALIAGAMHLPYAGHLYTPVDEGEITADFSWKSPLSALMNPQDGFAALAGCYVMRDGRDVFFLPSSEEGAPSYAVEYGVNLLGVDCRENVSGVVTRVIPVAKNADGSDLFLPELYRESQISYPFQRVKRLSVNAKVGQTIERTDGASVTLTEEDVLSQMREEAQAQFDVERVDRPNITMSVDYIHLPKTREYAAYHALRDAAPYDWIRVKDTPMGISAVIRMTGYTWDLVREQYLKATFGQKAQSAIASWELGSGSVTARALAARSVGGSAIVPGSITAREIAAGSITAEQMAARVITTELLAANAVTAHEIAAAAITADHLAAGSVTASKIAANAIEAGHLSASALTAIDAEISTANIGYAQIKDASIQSLIARDAVTDRYYIDKLAVRNAQMVQATVGELVIKAADNKYYRLDVAANGSVTPTEVTLTSNEIAAGVTSDGHGAIIETDLTVADLSASNMKAVSALIDKLTASRIDVAELFARSATISQLQAVDISGNTSLHLYVQDNTNKTYAQRTDPAAGNAVHDGDIWIQSDGLRTWGDLSALTWGEAATYKWGDFTAAKQYVRKGGAWALTDDPGSKYTVRSGIDILPLGIEIGGSKYIRMLSGADFQIKAGGTFTVDSGNFSIDANGNVTMAGTVSAADGQIADWAILPGRLKSGDGAGYVALDSDPTHTYAIWAGAEAADTAPFRVARDGTVYAAKIVTETETGGSTQVDLTQFPLWKLWYNVVKSYTSNSITLSNGDTINFNTAAATTLTGSWSGLTFTAEAKDAQNATVATKQETLTRSITPNQSGSTLSLFDSTHKMILSVGATSQSVGPLWTWTVDASGEYAAGVSDGQTTGYLSGWNSAYSMVSPPGAGTGTSFSVTVPSQAADTFQSLTFTLSKGDAPGSSGYAAVSRTGTTVARIAIGDWYDAGWNDCLDNCTGYTCYTGTIRQLYDPDRDVYVLAVTNYSTWTLYALPNRK